MKRSDTYASGYLKAKDMLDQGHVRGLNLTIKSVRSAVMDDGNKQRVLGFQEDDRELGLNVTNWDTLAAMFGDDDDQWIGRTANYHPHKLDRPYNNQTHGVRVSPANNGQATAMSEPFEDRVVGYSPPMSLREAVEKGAAHGISKEQIVAAARIRGMTAWNPIAGASVLDELVRNVKDPYTLPDGTVINDTDSRHPAFIPF